MCALLDFVASQVLSLVWVAVLHDTTEQDKEERERRLFVSNVSHELRTPLTSVKSYLEALDDGALSEPVAPDFVKVSLNETNRMMRMVTDLLSLSRIDNETSQLDIELTNFTAFITFILNRFDKIKSQIARRYKEVWTDPGIPDHTDLGWNWYG